MKFPSLSSLVYKAGGTFFRFPLAILLALTATGVSIAMVNMERHWSDALFIRCTHIIISCYLGMLLSVAAKVWTERKAWRLRAALAIQVVVLALAVGYYFIMPDYIEEKTVIRWVLYALGLHWLIAVIGFAGSQHINGFWQYNKVLFLRILTSLLYTTVLYLGLALALLAIDHLFNADLSYKWYMDIWLVLIGIFNTWFFLAGFPKEYGEVDVITDYPKGLKIFTQYVLLPLLTVYMAILYVYLFKIVFTAHWPSGWVAYLVLGFSVAGILALLLIYPIRNDENNKWINAYSRFFYFALFPLLVLLGFAIWKRVREYGVTELRYFVLLLAGWLLCMAVYFLWSRKRNIQLIPLSLCLFAFLSSFGPWGVFNVSRHSQQNRLKGLLVKNGLFANGRVTGAHVKIPVDDRKEITSATEYIVSVHGYQPLQPWFHQNLDSMMRKDSMMGKYEDRERTEHILNLINVSYTGRFERDDDGAYFNCRLQDEGSYVLATTGTDYVIPGLSVTAMSTSDTTYDRYQLGQDSLLVSLDSTHNRLHFAYFTGAKPGIKDSVFDVGIGSEAFPKDVQYGMELPPEKMTLIIQSPRWNGKLILKEISGIKRDGVFHITQVEGWLLLGRTMRKV